MGAAVNAGGPSRHPLRHRSIPNERPGISTLPLVSTNARTTPAKALHAPRFNLEYRCEKRQGTVTIRIEDTGTGISSPENLFRPFQRGAESSGLGLYVRRRSCVALVGNFAVRRNWKVAVSLWCCLYRLRRRSQSMSETVEKAIHILLLDDHALFRESVARLLASEPGFDIAGHAGV